MSNLRSLPAVDLILKSERAEKLISEFGRGLTLETIRSVLDEIRKGYKQGDFIPDSDGILGKVADELEMKLPLTLREVINASGVILHTNLGRAPLAHSAIKAIHSLSYGYSSLEFDLDSGKRGTRFVHSENLLIQLTGAEAAMVVNNNAAAVLLSLTALAKGRSVVISRSQLVEIGGGFRVPDVMKQSGARLVEVGTTNRVHVRDYQAALENPAVMILHAHHSNFKLIGFTAEPSLRELSAIAKEHNVLLMDDIGSGALVNTEQFGLIHEPMVQESLAAGADIVCFSGDKLLGGPQAGIITGRADLLKKIKKHPLTRALRPDKLCLAALTETLWHYVKGTYKDEIPIWKMIAASDLQIRDRAQRWHEKLGFGEICSGFSTIGGGSMPEEKIPTYLLSLRVRKPDRFLKQLRTLKPAIIARIEDDSVLLDPRTVLPEQEDDLLRGVSINFIKYNP